MGDHVTEIVVFTLLFLLVSGMGFVAARWRAPSDMAHLDEWGLGGRSFGGWITWFLVGGDLYTAYTFVAVPALLFGAGAAGFFAVPYTIIIYPLVFLVLVRLWSVSHRHGFVTPADFVRSRFQSPTLALLIAITGIVATMPYIALQLVGIEAVLKTMGVTGESTIARHLPIIIAFAILAAYTYQSGLRAPALIAFVKDTLIYIVIIVAVIYLPYKLGGWGDIFAAADAKFDASPAPNDGILLNANNQIQYMTLALGSALALFLYPHSITGVLASKNRDVIKRNMSALPAYSLLLGLIALLGYMAIAAGVKPLPNAAGTGADSNTVVPLLFDQQFPGWFAGIAFAAIGIGALVPAAIMSIAAANLFTRNIYKEYLRKDATHGAGGQRLEDRLAGREGRRGGLHRVPRPAVLHRPAADRRRHHPADAAVGGAGHLHPVVPPRRPHRRLGGRHAAGHSGCSTRSRTPPPAARTSAARRSRFSKFGFDSTKTIYVGLVAVVVNLLVAALVTLALRAGKVPDGGDGTEPDDYFADEGDPRVQPIPLARTPEEDEAAADDEAAGERRQTA